MRVGELTRMRSGECGDTGPVLLPAPVGVDAADVGVTSIGGVGVLADADAGVVVVSMIGDMVAVTDGGECDSSDMDDEDDEEEGCWPAGGD